MATEPAIIETIEPQARRWTQQEYFQMAELNWFEGHRVQLIDGEVVMMSPQRHAHAAAIALAEEALRAVFESGHWIRIQMPLNLGPHSLPEPDVAVVRGTIRDFSDHPTSAVLVLEVSDTTLEFDRNEKSRLYADANLEDYWLVNLIDRQLEVFRNPIRHVAEDDSPRYGDLRILKPQETIEPLATPDKMISVRDLLP